MGRVGDFGADLSHLLSLITRTAVCHDTRAFVVVALLRHGCLLLMLRAFAGVYGGLLRMTDGVGGELMSWHLERLALCRWMQLMLLGHGTSRRV